MERLCGEDPFDLVGHEIIEIPPPPPPPPPPPSTAILPGHSKCAILKDSNV